MATSEDVFVEAHRAQLTQIGLPEHLWSSVWSQLQQAQVSYDGLQLARLLGDDGAEGAEMGKDLVVLASRDLSSASDVFVLDHAWNFRSLADAAQALSQVDGLPQRVHELMFHFAPPAADDAAAITARVLEQLPSFAGMYQVAAPAPQSSDAGGIGERLELQSVFYVLDEVGARIAVASGEGCNLHMAPLLHMHSGMSFCVAWPAEDVAAGDILRRAASPDAAAALAHCAAPLAPPAVSAAAKATGGGAPAALAPVALCTVDCPYLRALILRCFAKRPTWAVFESAEAAATAGFDSAAVSYHWGEYEDLDWDRVDAGALSASCFVTRKGLIRKANLAYNVNKWTAKRPAGALAGATPETKVVQVDGIDQIESVIDGLGVHFNTDAAGCESNDTTATAWMLKPSVTNQAQGIAVARSRAEVRQSLAASPDLREWVLQRYVQRPLLVDGRKFHLRVYVLAVGNIAVHVFPEFLALFSLQKYGPIPPTAAVDMHAHLTNTCAQGDLTEEEELKAVRMWRELRADLEKQGCVDVEANIAAVEESVHQILGECFQAVHTELNFQVRCCSVASLASHAVRRPDEGATALMPSVFPAVYSQLLCALYFRAKGARQLL